MPSTGRPPGLWGGVERKLSERLRRIQASTEGTRTSSGRSVLIASSQMNGFTDESAVAAGIVTSARSGQLPGFAGDRHSLRGPTGSGGTRTRRTRGRSARSCLGSTTAKTPMMALFRALILRQAKDNDVVERCMSAKTRTAAGNEAATERKQDRNCPRRKADSLLRSMLRSGDVHPRPRPSERGTA